MQRDWFLPAVLVSVVLHGAIVYTTMNRDVPPKLHAIRRSVATVSLHRTRVEPEIERPIEQLRSSPPRAELLRETAIESPVKRLFSEAPPMLKPAEVLDLKPSKTPPPIMEQARAEEPPPPEAPQPERRPRRKQTAIAPPPPDEVPIAEEMQDASAASGGNEVVQTSLSFNPLPPFPAGYSLTHPTPSRRIAELMELTVLVGTDGKPVSCEVLTTCGVATVDRQIAEFVLKHWNWEPARRGDTPIAAQTIVRLNFKKQQAFRNR